jgi:predicted enzyme related to lactoylglutathione lyase
MYNMATIVHFDVPAENINRAKKFYEELFEWKIEPVPGPMDYFEITTKDENGKEGVAGGMGKRGQPDQKIVNYIGVKPIDEYIEKAQRLGGKIIMQKTTIPGFGYLATIIDTEGNIIGLWETDPAAKM